MNYRREFSLAFALAAIFLCTLAQATQISPEQEYNTKYDMATKPGGLKPAEHVNQEVADLAHKHKADIESKAGKTFSHFNPVEYSSQIVAGVNYFIKIDVGNNEHIVARIYKNLQQESSLHSIKTGLSATDGITYF
mmetsp:Transcript_4063/g.5695  ORF Transcript_4063/g.5695 Transcript_4063/m.5695 type:complete len:136 (-) Transcript_4063:44-451(-)